MWSAKKSNRFEHRYNKLSDQMAERVDEAIGSLLSSERPELKGVRKTANLKDYWSWELGNKCRVLYRPIYSEKAIEFFKVCSHDEVYHP